MVSFYFKNLDSSIYILCTQPPKAGGWGTHTACLYTFDIHDVNFILKNKNIESNKILCIGVLIWETGYQSITIYSTFSGKGVCP